MAKKKKYRIFISIIAVSITVSLHGQIIFQPKPVEYNFKGVVYKTEKIFGGKITTSGLAISYKTGKLKSYYNTSYYNFELGYIKDSRERKQNKNISFPSVGLSPSFIYGKRNHFINLRLSAGGKKFLSEKTKRRGIAVGFIYEGGASIGLLKPVTLQVIKNNLETFEPELVEISYSDDNAEQFLAYDDIYGSLGFFNGFTSTSITVGAHGKIAGHFALGAFEEKVRALEIGLMVDIFPGKVPILAEREGVKNKFIFLNLYLSLQFGRRK
ncbi:MAG: hypothetical protein V3V00_01165 [Saprospiraceae bacterium]